MDNVIRSEATGKSTGRPRKTTANVDAQGGLFQNLHLNQAGAWIASFVEDGVSPFTRRWVPCPETTEGSEAAAAPR